MLSSNSFIQSLFFGILVIVVLLLAGVKMVEMNYAFHHYGSIKLFEMPVNCDRAKGELHEK